jgi:hypothetical protein
MLPSVMKKHAILELFQKPDQIAARRPSGDRGSGSRRDSDRSGSRGFGGECSSGGRTDFQFSRFRIVQGLIL